MVVAGGLAVVVVFAFGQAQYAHQNTTEKQIRRSLNVCVCTMNQESNTEWSGRSLSEYCGGAPTVIAVQDCQGCIASPWWRAEGAHISIDGTDFTIAAALAPPTNFWLMNLNRGRVGLLTHGLDKVEGSKFSIDSDVTGTTIKGSVGMQFTHHGNFPLWVTSTHATEGVRCKKRDEKCEGRGLACSKSKPGLSPFSKYEGLYAEIQRTSHLKEVGGSVQSKNGGPVIMGMDSNVRAQDAQGCPIFPCEGSAHCIAHNDRLIKDTARDDHDYAGAESMDGNLALMTDVLPGFTQQHDTSLDGTCPTYQRARTDKHGEAPSTGCGRFDPEKPISFVDRLYTRDRDNLDVLEVGHLRRETDHDVMCMIVAVPEAPVARATQAEPDVMGGFFDNGHGHAKVAAQLALGTIVGAVAVVAVGFPMYLKFSRGLDHHDPVAPTLMGHRR